MNLPEPRLFECNPRPRIEVLNLDGGGQCWIVDDVLLHPERIVQWARQRRDRFRRDDFGYYPGISLRPPQQISDRLTAFFNLHMRRHFDARRVQHTECRLSLVTLQPRELLPIQWFCHRDASLLEPHESRQASILYLFKDSAVGGTSFYEPARTAAETLTLFGDARVMTPGAFQQKYAVDYGYIGASNAYFTRVGGVAAKWNRMIFYDGFMLHSGDIPAPDRLSDDPESGRLTLNGFFVSRRRLQSI